MLTQQVLIFICVAVAAGGVLYAFVYPYLSGEVRAEKRQAALARGTGAGLKKADRNVDQSNRRKQIADSLKELEQKGAKKRISIETKLGQAGLETTKTTFMVASAASGLTLGLAVFLISEDLLSAVPAALVGGLGLPNWVISFLKKRRIKKFVMEFPNAIDVIIRGVKAGLPLGDCLRIVATESAEPVRSEFRQIIEATAIGLSIGEGVERLVERVPIAETNFFSIVINIQQKAGGNLSEALGNLSRVLRDRKKMDLKVKAMSSEAKASAGIIGSLPFFVSFFVYVSSPRYIELLWITGTGRLILAVCLVWMMVGIMSMKKMISFDL